jgi:hypothetical protein
MKKRKRTKGMEEARPFEGLSKVHQNAAGVDIGATEIMVCVSGGDEIQLVKAFGNYYYPDALSGHGGLAVNLRMVAQA